MITVAHIKKTNNEIFEEIRGYDELNIQPHCFVFQWFDTQETFIIPIHNVEYIMTSQEESLNEESNQQSSD